MPRIARVCTCICMVVLGLALAANAANAAAHLTRAAAPAPEERPANGPLARAAFEFTLEPLTPSTLFDLDPFDTSTPYHNFTLTNTGTSSDTYRLIVDNVSNPASFFAQVCIGLTCFIDSTTHSLAAGADTTVGVLLSPFDNGSSSADFHVFSVGEPSNQAHFTVTMYAGTAAVDVDVVQQGVESASLEQNAPNPVRAGTAIAFSLPKEDRVKLAIYDVAGRVVTTLADEVVGPGRHVMTWNGTADDGRDLTSGVYFYRLTTSTGSHSKSLTFVR